MESFHKRLKRLRTDCGLSAKEFARRLGVPESTYRTWEYGGGIVGQPYLKMSELLGVSLHELLTGETPKPDELIALLDKMERLSGEIKKKILPLF